MPKNRRKLLSFLIIFLLAPSAWCSPYALDQSHIEASFLKSEDITLHIPKMLGNAIYDTQSNKVEGDKSQTTAAIIALTSPIAASVVASVIYMVGGLATLSFGGVGALFCIPVYGLAFIPFHRFYLETDGNNFKVGALYCISTSWCGTLHFIDGIMLLLDDTKSKYIGNPKYVMWAD